MKVHANMRFGAKNGGALMQTCLAKSSSITSKWGAWHVQDDIGWDEVDPAHVCCQSRCPYWRPCFLESILEESVCVCVCVCVCVGSDVA